MEEHENDTGIPGVHALDHTADVGLELSAPDLVELVRRAALGLTWLLLDRWPAGSLVERPLRAQAKHPDALLRDVLRELLWWHDSEGIVLAELNEARVEEREGQLAFAAHAVLSRDPAPPAREIKGVTLHGLVAERSGGEWRGRVIFDV